VPLLGVLGLQRSLHSADRPIRYPLSVRQASGLWFVVCAEVCQFGVLLRKAGRATMLLDQHPRRRLGDLLTEEPQFPRRLLSLWLGTGTLILAAVGLLVLAVYFQGQYAQAHAGPRPVVPPAPSPQFFADRANYAAHGIGLLCVVALMVTWKTRHPVSLAALGVCIPIYLYTIVIVLVRY
jgi:hypothetical protein